jgi:uncharacterized membrane protein
MGILAAFIIALLISSLFSSGYRKDGSWGALTIFFLILFMAGIVGHHWIVPFGPMMYGISFFPMLFFILIVAFLFSAPSPHQRTTTKTDEKVGGAASVLVGISIFIWLLFILFIIAAIAGYYK